MILTGKRNNTFSTTALLLVLLLVLICIACLIGGCSREKERRAAREKLTIAVPPLPYSLLVSVANEQRLFVGEGLDVTIIPLGLGLETLVTVNSGKADLAVASDTSLMFAVLKGEKLSILAEICGSRYELGVVARRDRNIRNPGDLRGKKIGITPGTVGEFYLDSLLILNNMELGMVRIFPLLPHQMPGAIRRGEVDAAAVWNPTISEIQKELGEKGITFYEETAPPFVMLLSGSQEFVRRRPETAAKVLRALIAAEAFVRDNPGEAVRIVSAASGMEQKYLTERWNDFTFEVTLDQHLVINLEDQARWAMRKGLNGAGVVPNFLDYINATPLTRLRPRAVTLIQ